MTVSRIIGSCLLLGLALPQNAFADAPSPLGNWARGDGKARVVVERCGEAFCAINTWIRPDTKDEHVGDKLVMDVKSDEPAHWTGTAFDPQRNLSYKMTLSVQTRTMTTNGCVLGGLLCKDMGWTRIGSIKQ